MKEFHYKALNYVGGTVEGQTVAHSQDAAFKALTQSGLAVYEICIAPEVAPNHKLQTNSRLTRHIGDVALARSCLDISKLLSRQYSIDESLQIASETSFDKSVIHLLKDVRQEIRKGTPLHVAFNDHAASLPNELISLLRAGDGSNSLQPAFESAGRLLQQRSNTKSKLVSALAYPSFLLLGTLAVFSFIQIQLVPTLYETSVSSGNPPPQILIFLTNINFWLSKYAVLVAPMVLAMIIAGVVFRQRLISQLREKLPSLRRLNAELEFARSARILSAFLMSGEQLVEALAEARAAAVAKSVKEILTRARQSIIIGETAGAVFVSDQKVPRIFANFFSLGEKSNDLVNNLDLAAEMLEHSYSQKTERLVSIAGPTMTLVIGLLVGFVVYALISAVIGITEIAI